MSRAVTGPDFHLIRVMLTAMIQLRVEAVELVKMFLY